MATTTHHPPCDLPIGTLVLVTPFACEMREPYRARIVGTDIFGSKYQVGAEWWRNSGRFDDGGQWAFPGQVEPITTPEEG